MAGDIFIGVDIGTSGVRGCAIDAGGAVVGSAVADMPPPIRAGAAVEQDPAIWWAATEALLGRLREIIDFDAVRRIAIDGTSGTLLLVDDAGEPVGPALMYNDSRATVEAQRIKAVAPAESAAHGATSALAKLLYLLDHNGSSQGRRAMHQADWIAGRLTDRFGFSDDNNALKLGFDPVSRSWPEWLDLLSVPRSLLPRVIAPGALVGTMAPSLARRMGMRADVEIRAGTTDGVAAFLATRASALGDAVTSLGSTLVVKVLADHPVSAPAYGVYSHRLGRHWLAGGASNAGGAALLAHFSVAQIVALTPRLSPDCPTGLSYYPLPARGERFPICDPNMAPVVTPRPDEDAMFLQGLLEGIANIEAMAYGRLAELGAPAPRRVVTVGGGARNDAWTRIRARRLGVPVTVAVETEAALGAALIARHAGPPP